VPLFTSLRAKLVLILIAITVAAVAASTGYTIHLQKQSALKRTTERATEDLNLIGSEIQTHLQWVTRDIFVLKDLPQLHRFLETKEPAHKADALRSIEQTFLNLARHHRIYHQVRFLDEAGLEVVRINWDGKQARLVPVESLQKKSHRYYFKEAVNLKSGQIYISHLDLNVEHGIIERPFVPTVRYATPVIDRFKKTCGIIVLNVLGRALLHVLEQKQEQVMHSCRQYFLLNNRGFFLFHPDPTKTFGFMLDSGERLGRYEPGLVKQISDMDTKEGVLIKKSETSQKLTVFAFRRISQWMGPPDSLHFSLGTPAARSPGKDYWILLSAADEAEILVGLEKYSKPFLFFTVFLLVGCVLVAILVGVLVSRPVVSLAAAARQIQDGNLTARARVNSGDEIGQFGRLFDNMASELEQSINRLKASETKYRQLFQNSRECFFVADTSGLIIDMNRACAQLLGLSPDEGIPSNFYLPWCNESSEDSQTLWEAVHGAGYVKDHEVHFSLADGSRLVCLMTANVRLGGEGTILGCEGGLRDITERRKRIEAKRDFRRRLQKEIVMAEERERRAMGQILHEELAQNLALIQMKIQETEALIAEPDSSINSGLLESQKLLGHMIRQIRTMIFDLYPAILDQRGLIPAMHWFAEGFTERTGIPATVFELVKTVHLTRPQEVYLFRAFKELLHNAWKHADANEIVVTVAAGSNGSLRLVVDDDGKGFDTRPAIEFSQQIKGIGLFSIREWITDMDGSFTIESHKGSGTRVLIEIPLSLQEGKNG